MADPRPESTVPELTAAAIADKKFTPVRLREGYDMGEVDAFLDEVEAALRAHEARPDEQAIYNTLHEDFESTLDARAEKLAEEKLHEAQAAFGREREALEHQVLALEKTQARLEEELSTLREQAKGEAFEREPAGVSEEAVAEASQAAVRLLALAQETHDRLLREAGQAVEEAEVRAAEIVRLTEAEAAAHREELLRAQEEEREEVERALAALRSTEVSVREHLRAYLSETLSSLEK